MHGHFLFGIQMFITRWNKKQHCLQNCYNETRTLDFISRLALFMQCFVVQAQTCRLGLTSINMNYVSSGYFGANLTCKRFKSRMQTEDILCLSIYQWAHVERIHKIRIYHFPLWAIGKTRFFYCPKLSLLKKSWSFVQTLLLNKYAYACLSMELNQRNLLFSTYLMNQ